MSALFLSTHHAYLISPPPLDLSLSSPHPTPTLSPSCTCFDGAPFPPPPPSSLLLSPDSHFLLDPFLHPPLTWPPPRHGLSYRACPPSSMTVPRL
jgi:hypothetical protein